MRKFLAATSLLASGLMFSEVSAAPVLINKTGSFEFWRDSDPLTDGDRSFIAVDALEKNGYIGWGCQDDLLLIYIRQPEQSYSLGNEYNVLLRFDKNKAIAQNDWIPATNEESIFMDTGNVEEFTVEALKSSQLIMRTTGDSGREVLSTFKLNGLESSLKKLSCPDI